MTPPKRMRRTRTVRKNARKNSRKDSHHGLLREVCRFGQSRPFHSKPLGTDGCCFFGLGSHRFVHTGISWEKLPRGVCQGIGINRASIVEPKDYAMYPHDHEEAQYYKDLSVTTQSGGGVAKPEILLLESWT